MQKKYGAIVVLLLAGSFLYSPAYADQRSKSRGRHEVVIAERTRQHQNAWITHSNWLGFSLIFKTPAKKVIVANIPVKECPARYIYVPQTTTVYALQPQTSYTETITIHVPNSNGSYTPVRLIRSNNGYIGPQGEYYSGNPTVEQLKVLYGK